MNIRLALILIVVAALAGCANATRRAPSLAESPAPVPQPPRRNLLREAGDTTWKVVTAPARLVTPTPKPKPVAVEPTEPPSAVIVRRTYGDDAPTTQPTR